MTLHPKDGMRIAFFGSSLLSAYWNGAATYYRGIIRALHARGHCVTFFEPDAFDRQSHRDMDPPPYARSVVYSAAGEDGVREALRAARSADIVVKASGVGVFDAFLEEAVLDLRVGRSRIVFWDVDAPATLDRVEGDASDHFRPLIPEYDFILTYGGGPPVVERYQALGARACVPVYNALDPETHHPADPDERFRGSLGFLANRMPDREARVHEFFFTPARRLPRHRFVLGGNGWHDGVPSLANVAALGHVYTRDHNAFNSTPMAVLNVSRDSMARCGYSPATRVFEAAGAGACLITDTWRGLDLFLQPGRECIAVSDGEEVAAVLRDLAPSDARAIGRRALDRIHAEHTYSRRAAQVEALFQSALSSSEVPRP